MTGSMYDNIIVNIYFWLIFGLAAGVLFTLMILINARKNARFDSAPKRTRKTKTVRKSKAASSPFADKLGEKVVLYMIEVARSTDRTLVKDRINKIRSECERLNLTPLPKANKEIISTVLIWSKRFNVESHLNEMKLFNKSSQISYDPKKRDFKLMIKQD